MTTEIKNLKLDATRAYNKAVNNGYALYIGNSLESALWMAWDYAVRAASCAEDPSFVDRSLIRELMNKSRDMVNESYRLMETITPEFPPNDDTLFYSPFPAIE